MIRKGACMNTISNYTFNPCYSLVVIDHCFTLLMLYNNIVNALIPHRKRESIIEENDMSSLTLGLFVLGTIRL